MADRTFKHGLVVGLFLGLLVGLLLGIHLLLGFIGYYDAVAIVENETTSKMLTRDGAYIGALGFAGLVLFGSSILIRVFGINRFDTKKQNAGSIMVIVATLFLAIFYVHYAFWYPNSFSNIIMYGATVTSFVLFVVGAAMVGVTPKKQPSVSAD